MIPWYVYALLSSFTATFMFIIRKRALSYFHSFQFESARTLSELCIVLLLFPFINLSMDFWAYILIYLMSLLAVIAIFLQSKALKLLDLSIVSPMRSLKAAFVALFAFLILNESISLQNFFGIGIILIGVYLLEADKHFDDILKPFKLLFSSSGSIYLISAIVIFSITSIFDKFVLNTYTDPISLAFFIWIFIGINFNIVHAIFYGFSDTINCIIKKPFLPIGAAFFSIITIIFAYSALELAYVSLVTPILMLSTLFMIFFGGKFFHEENLLYRLVISAFMIIGTILIVL